MSSSGEERIMSLELIEDGAGDPRNARYLATACDLAYLPEAQGKEGFRTQLGLEAKLVSVGNTQVYVGENSKSVVVAFRGSESPNTLDGLKDWLLTNANNFLVIPEGQIGTDFAAAGVGARFHRGFMTALADIWDPLFAAVDALQEKAERPLWLTGHSLGGALALLAAWRFQRKFVSVHQVYTFGAPMIGNAAAAQAFEKEFPGKIFRYIDDRDMVPRLPTMSLLANEYGHCLTEMIVNIAKAAGASTGEAAQALQQLAGEAGSGPMDPGLMERVWGRVTQGLSCHLMANYLTHLGERCKELA
jgi:pimeloyl-ACP methyl ester carboxylesterase